MSMPIPIEFLESNAAELVALAVETLRLYTEPGARQAVTAFIRASCAQVVRVCERLESFVIRVWGSVFGGIMGLCIPTCRWGDGAQPASRAQVRQGGDGTRTWGDMRGAVGWDLGWMGRAIFIPCAAACSEVHL